MLYLRIIFCAYNFYRDILEPYQYMVDNICIFYMMIWKYSLNYRKKSIWLISNKNTNELEIRLNRKKAALFSCTNNKCIHRPLFRLGKKILPWCNIVYLISLCNKQCCIIVYQDLVFKYPSFRVRSRTICISMCNVFIWKHSITLKWRSYQFHFLFLEK